jgi:4-methyl-5(b-hydroxyethyl)-thiazole monophosphate biosynthesis
MVPLAEGFEEIEAVTVIDILRRGDIDVVVAGMGSETVAGSHHIAVKCNTLIEAVRKEELNGIVLPGGMPGTKNLLTHTLLRDIIIELDKQDKLVAAICAAPTVLVAAGILKHKRATCYPSFEKDMTGTQYLTDPVVRHGNVITSRGPGTALVFSLAIVGALLGDEKSLELKKAVLG